jgi:peptidoglycan/LPS O-acetylase OafA/YrhL
MTRSESIYLDVVRLTAAVLVVVTHAVQNELLPLSWAAYVPDLGREAVIVFFVLSGYVIAFSAETKYASLDRYFISRASRLYSVALPVLLIAFVVDSSAMYFNGSTYPHEYQYERFYFYIPFHLLFLGEIWAVAERPFTADPYWSLSYEAWYYVWFATLFYFCGWRRVILFLLVALVVGYQHLILFPIWLSGVALYRNRERLVLSIVAARIGMILSGAAVVVLEYSGGDIWLWQLGRDTWPFPALPQGSADQYFLDYVVCLCACAHLHCARFAKLDLFLRWESFIKSCAAYTFTLYLTHTIVMFTWIYNYHFDRENWRHLVLMCWLIVVATYTIGYLTERRRDIFQRGCTSLVMFLERTIDQLPGVRVFRSSKAPRT